MRLYGDLRSGNCYKVRLMLQLDRSSWSYTAIVDAISGNTERVDGITAAGQAVAITRRVPMHWTLGLMAKHTPSAGVELYAGIDNVFNRLQFFVCHFGKV